ncbi:ClpXP adapter SpxH family protein [Spirosoma oryzicola]|uniref:ClpXP adapter SpxH family protein n=1 Tax=Spirosoma oryzicola TaxID=2898794 RepID=UPI001E2FA8B1|nr:ClpXP adapter SpxH family protein [Spirosoma oryzicola]UHG94003.1 DsbA family protein [Spirosoma oryzicola]
MENKIQNPLLCDIETGMCEMPDSATTVAVQTVSPVKIIYFTDPICSSCWGIEPQLRKLKLEYGKSIELEYRMGGLLPDWSYNSGGISKPSDVAHHWDEVSLHYDMPIDGDVWLEDPLDSSYPASIAFKAAQLQDPHKAVLFLREMREMVFLHKKNIAKWEHLATAAQTVGLDLEQLKTDYQGKAKTLFQADLALGKQLGVRGFPTMFFVDSQGQPEKVYGSKPYIAYEDALQKQLPSVKKTTIDPNWESLFSVYHTLTSREFAELSGRKRQEVDSYLQHLTDEGKLRKVTTKNGVLWILQ